MIPLVRLIRGASSDKGTFGMMVLDGEPLCVTCEDPWNDNKPNISCVPAGLYRCVEHNGAKFKNVWRLLDVPGRSAILIHNGVNINHTEGCILVGRGFFDFANLPGITDSRLTLDMLHVKLPGEFNLKIYNQP